MGTFRLFALVMAFVSPLVTVSGWIAILIAFGGAGAPMMMLVATVLVAVFSVGFVAWDTTCRVLARSTPT